MKRIGFRTRVVAGLILGLGGAQSAVAQSAAADFGKYEYTNSCAVCHGAEGKGDGPFAGLLNGKSPTDLTQLQKNNGGVFPVSAMYAAIDGSADVRAHGTREMPFWGMRFKERVANDAEMGPIAAEEYPRMRILALIEYISTLQAK